MPTSSTAIVIGAGFGGLAAALRLRARGYDVTLLEANEQLGGRASVFRQDGYVFDGGPTVVTAPYLFDELVQLFGKDPKDYYELVPVDPFYRVKFPDGTYFDYVGEQDRIIEQIEKFNPDDVKGYLKLVDLCRRIFEIGYLQLADSPFDTVSDMLRIAPELVKLKSYRTVYGLVASYIKDPRLRQVFTFQPLLVGGNPFQTTSIYMLIHWLERKWGVWFAKGGTGSLVKALGRLCEEEGVDVRLNSPVAKIDVVAGEVRGVITESGERLEADVVVSNADPSMVYRHMIDEKYRSRNTNGRVKRMEQSMSLFVAYFGAEGHWPEAKHHEIILGPRYKGLLTDIFKRKKLADDYSLYLHCPSRTDSSLAPEGHEAFYVLSPVPNERSGLDWSEIQGEYWDKILGTIEERALPGIRDRITTTKLVDPRYFSGRLRSMDGAAFGPAPIFRQSAWFRYHNRSKDVNGLFFVGAGTHPGAGLPGVLSSAKVLDRAVPAPVAKPRLITERKSA